MLQIPSSLAGQYRGLADVGDAHNCRVTESLNLRNLGIDDESMPLVDVFLDEGGKFLGRVRDNIEANLLAFGLDIRELQRPDDFAVQKSDDVRRRSRWNKDACIVSDSWPSTPASAMVGTSGSDAQRLAEVTASARSVPATSCG
jgi:hypothetical protein